MIVNPPSFSLTPAKHQGFSLPECVISVAISATSLLAVIGMLTGTLSVARDSKEETVSGVLLRQLAGEMRDLPAIPPPGENGSSAPAQPITLLVDESLKVLDHSQFAESKIQQTYENGSEQLTASAFARLKRVAIPGDKLMDRVLIRIETPASAPAANRIVREYAALSPK